MQTVAEVMSRNVQVVSPGESLQRAAQLMGQLDVGALPVCDGERLVGMVTDRDLAVRGMGAGKSPLDAHVDEVMSADLRWCFEDQALDEVMAQMAGGQVRRMPVVTHDGQQRLVGIVSLGDLATRAGEQHEAHVEQTLETVSAPGAASADQAPTGTTASGVPEALTGIDERPQGDMLAGVARVSGQDRIDEAGEPLRNAGSHDPADLAGQAADTDGRKPPSTPSNAA